jgi:RimJ/RimL family protein N-acetyltransferase
MSLTTSRLILRPWRDTDLSEFARLNADPAVTEFLRRRLSRDESDAFALHIRTGMEERGWGFWAMEVKAGADAGAPFIGFVGLSIPSFEAHFTPWWIGGSRRNTGVSVTPVRELPRAFVLLSRN